MLRGREHANQERGIPKSHRGRETTPKDVLFKKGICVTEISNDVVPIFRRTNHTIHSAFGVEG